MIKKKCAYPCFYSNQRLADLASGKLSTEDATIEDSVFKEFDLETIWGKMENENILYIISSGSLEQNQEFDY